MDYEKALDNIDEEIAGLEERKEELIVERREADRIKTDYCSFCGESGKIMSSMGGVVFICKECAITSLKVIAGEEI